jgi:glycosyltransferase involved in cell wall biosynthesis
MGTREVSSMPWKEYLRGQWPGAFQLLKKAKGSTGVLLKKAKQLTRKTPPSYAHFKTYRVQVQKPILPGRKKVLHVIANFWMGGSAQLVIDIVERLGHLYEQRVITNDIPEIPAYDGIHITLVQGTDDIQPYLAALKSFGPDMVHVHYLGHQKDKWGIEDYNWYRAFFEAAEKLNCKVVENINIPTEPYVSEVVRRYVYVSEYVRERFGSPDLPGQVVYPGSNLSHFRRNSISSVPDDCIGMVYRLERDKLNEHSIDVFIETVRQRPRTKALIVGGGNLLDHFRSKVSEAGLARSFQFTGYVSYNDLPRYFERMSIFIAPVHTESFGQVSPFAMHMGIPVVGYSVDALPEIVGDPQLLARPADHDALSKIIIELLNDRERRLRIGQSNVARAQAHFSVEQMIDAYGEIYEGMVREKFSTCE